MPEKLEAVIIAKDQASPVFKKVADGAEDMGQEIEEAGQKSTRSMREMGNEAKTLGLGIGVLVSGMALTGQSARDLEIANNNLSRSYGDAADDMRQFAEQIQDTTNFSNDQAIASENLAATLARNYAFTADEIRQVLQISADLAASTGYELEDATYRVVAALRGEAESAEQLGLTMNQAAIDSQNLTLTMSNQEAGHFRLNALIDQSAFAMGAAQEQADMTYGTMTELRDSVQDAGQAFGDFLGPVGEVGAFAADNAVQLGVMALAVGQVGRSMLAASAIAKGFGVSLGPIGLALAAGTLAYAGVKLLGDYLSDDFVSSEEEAIQSTQSLTEELVSLGEAGRLMGSTLTLAQVVRDFNTEVDSIDADSVNDLAEMIDRINDLMQAPGGADTGLAFDAAVFDNLTFAQKQFIDSQETVNGVMNDSIITHEELTAAAAAYREEAALDAEQNATLAAAADDLSFALKAQGEGASDLQEKVTAITQSYLDGYTPAEQYLAGLAHLTEEYRNQQVDIELTTAAVEDNTASYADAIPTLEEYIAAQGRLSEIRGGEALDTQRGIEAQERSIAAQQENAEALAHSAASYVVLAESQEVVIDRTSEYATRLAQLHQAQKQAFQDVAIDQIAADFDALTLATTGTTQALDNTFRVVVQNTNAIGSSSQALADWSEDLIAAEGTYSALDDLLASGAINIIEYNMAQEAYNDIQRENGEIQEHVQAIQAKQAPLLAEMAEQQENYLDQVANMPATQQLAALALMDTATNAQALDIAMAAAGGTSEEALLQIIQGAGAANPPLLAVLESMGLISVGADGTITMDTEGATSPLVELTEQIGELVDTLWEVFIDGDPSGAIGAAGEAQGALDGIDGATGTVSIDGDASGFEAVWSSVAGRSGTALVYVDAYGPGIGFTQTGNGGVIGGYADGGVVAEMGEWGNERLHFPNGGVATTNGRGMYQVPQGTYVSPAPGTSQTSGASGVTVNIYVEGGDMDRVAEEVSRKIVPAITRAFDVHGRGFGV